MSSNISEISSQAKLELPRLWEEITTIADSVNPIELLCQLSLLNLSHHEDEFPNVEEHARWQVRIELLTWHFLRSYDATKGEDVFVGDHILSPLEEKLDQYFAQYSISLLEAPVGDQVKDLETSLRVKMKSEALHVRGEGVPAQIEVLCKGIYGPHQDWFTKNLGFTIEDAFLIGNAFFELVSEKFSERRREAWQGQQQAIEEYEKLLSTHEAELSEDQMKTQANIRSIGVEESAKQFSLFSLFYQLRYGIGVTHTDLQEKLPDYSKEAIESFLTRLSHELGSVESDPDPIGMNPLVSRPFIRFEGMYFLPVPSAMYEAFLSTFHFDIWHDESYRSRYDDARAKWLEIQSLEALRGLFPQAKVHWSLMYGPKKNRQEVDGLVLFDNKLIFVECKWKSVTLSARMGNVEALETDLDKSIVAAFNQAKRARDFVKSSQGPVVFTDSAGVDVEIDPAKIREFVEVSLLGRGAMAILAANLPNLALPGMFDEGEYPWALALTDLALICDLLEFPSQLFDYLRRRVSIVGDKNRLIHDEWDILGLYLEGDLHTADSTKSGSVFEIFGKSDDRIDRYLRAKENPMLPRVEKPARKIPSGLKKYISAAEQCDQLGRSDFVIELLGLSDRRLEELWQAIQKVLKSTETDRGIHSTFAQFGERGVAFVSTAGDPEQMSNVLATYCEARKYRNKLKTCLGMGVDVTLPDPPHTLAFFHSNWQYDAELEKLAQTLLG
ncbi:MAG: hypothetical protein GC165_00135 [Armatimonadetes bacterium]|nr:hypothetical protein [Armatimonadota bacterium]